ncbi:MAG: thiamine phosphate synthase [Deltaproteobacteria bacterium]|nr:thiamine phosphate synthase [Deltaproteobacteria bacterium]MBW2256462.1 thiamine phosphate synthase [Deltaproteobacteria bacterium]
MTARADVKRRIRGLYGIADAQASGGDPVRMAAWLLEGGCRVVQLRCKGWRSDDILVAARQLRALCDAQQATLIINDWPEIAVAAAADGVHVGQLDADAKTARRIVGADRIVGRSTNDPEQVRYALRGADYLAYGPVYATTHLSRPKTVHGVAALASARAIIPAEVPLVAIGGITAERVVAVRHAGADAWAVIGAVASAADPVGAVRALVRAGG